MHAQTAQRIALEELRRRDVDTATIRSYMHYGNQLISQLRARDLPICYDGLCALARAREIRISTLEQRRTDMRFALATALLADADDLTPHEFDALADGLENLRARRDKTDPAKAAYLASRDCVEGGPDDVGAKARAARKREHKRRQGDIARLAVGPAQEHAAKRGYDDWRADLVDHARRDKDRGLLRVQAVTGCRPIELLHGVSVTVIDDGALVFCVHGAKLKNGEKDAQGRFVRRPRGQPERVFVLEPTADRLFEELGAQVESDGGIGVECTYTLAGTTADPVPDYCDRVIRLANRLGYENVSAYSLRHQFGADLKAARLTPDQRAAMMGHYSSRSQNVYGQSQTGREGLIKLSQIHVTHPIRNRAPGKKMNSTIAWPAAGDGAAHPAREQEPAPSTEVETNTDNGPGMR